jgi:hypothetical protein
VKNTSQGIGSSESHSYYGGNINLDEDVIDSDENLEALLESLGVSLSNDTIGFDESAGLDEGLEEIENVDNNDMDIEEDCNLSQMLDVSEGDDGDDSDLFNLDNLEGNTLSGESIPGTYFPKSDIQMLICIELHI